MSDDKLLALARYRESGMFTDLEMLVLDYAAAVTRTPVEVSDELFAQLREHFDNAQLVELTSVIALEGMRSRFNWASGWGRRLSDGMVCAVPQPAGGAAKEPTNGQRDLPSAA